MNNPGLHIRLLIILLLATGLQSMAQQEPYYSQEVFSYQTMNPAYTGLWGTTSATAIAREQWIGMNGAPSTQTLIFQTSSKDEKVGVGVSVVNDKIGLEKRLSVFGDYSYRLELDDETYLRLGLKLGFSNYSNNLAEYTIFDPNFDYDPVFQGKVEKGFIPNFGLGAFLYSDYYYLGLSIPKVIQSEINNSANEYVSYAQIRHLFFKSGYIFELANDIKFKPVFNMAIIIGAPVYMGFGANLLLKNQIWLGTYYRIGDSFGLSGQYYINDQLNIGYAVDFSPSGLSRYNYGSHEVIVSYHFKYANKRRKGIPLF